MPKIYHAKVGTQPWNIIFRYNYNLRIGKTVIFKEDNTLQWFTGIIIDITFGIFNEKILFIELM